MAENVFERIGARRIVNGMGIYTKLGGSIISPTVWSAMTEANDWAVEMSDLLDKSGDHLAKFLGADAARVVPGVAAGLALGVAACISRQDPSSVERLPETTGLKAGLVFQPKQKYRYLRAVWLSGAKPLWAGDENGTTVEQLEEAMSDESAVAALFPAHLDNTPGTVSLADFSRLARKHGVPVIIDAAFMSYPPGLTKRFIPDGDLVGFSAKYFYGPNGGGFLYGRRDLIDLVAALDFSRFETGEYLTFGRAFKLDRHTVVGTILALEEWFVMDHEARLGAYRRAIKVMEDAVRGVPGVQTKAMAFSGTETFVDKEPVNALTLRLAPGRPGVSSAAALHEALYGGEPRIVCHLDGDTVGIVVEAMGVGQEAEVAARLREVLAG